MEMKIHVQGFPTEATKIGHPRTMMIPQYLPLSIKRHSGLRVKYEQDEQDWDKGRGRYTDGQTYLYRMPTINLLVIKLFFALKM